MARKRISMKKIREVLRLKATTRLSDREIARAGNGKLNSLWGNMLAIYKCTINSIAVLAR
jgi:hypothetical protein